jgi:DNA (cytosine-5)-methyltransferase 1
MILTVSLKVASFFAGAGGLDLGFEKAGFDVVWANEFDKSIHETYRQNHKKTQLDTRSITEVRTTDLPKGIIGMIGGPPCQSWSEAGMLRGEEDHRGQLFFTYSNLIAETMPKFFLAENVSGLLFTKHRDALRRIFEPLLAIGYNISFGILNANHYDVPQDRERVIIVGYRFGKELFFEPPTPQPDAKRKNLKHAILKISDSAVPAREGKYANEGLSIPNHEYLVSSFSSIYMSRNRVRSWDEPSFTIQAGGRHAPIHPSAPRMIKVAKDQQVFAPGFESSYRRISVREAALIQTFPNDFVFHYKNVTDGYKMIGNAVPVNLAKALARKIRTDLEESGGKALRSRPHGELRSFSS